MSILKTVAPDEASGVVKENYALFDQLGTVPVPFQMFSASPDLQSLRVPTMRYYWEHPKLSAGLLAFIRMMVAEGLGYQYCLSFNRTVLKFMGIADDEQLAKAMADPSQLPLSESEAALLAFVLKAIKTPAQTSANDMEKLRKLGWSDGDILDACAHGADMMVHGTLFEAFKMGDGEAC